MMRRLQQALTTAVLLAAAVSAATAGEAKRATTIVFVCEHGTVKSVIAMQLFNKLAAAQGLSLRAVSRGMAPGAAVPQPIAQALSRDGLAPVGFKPRAFSRADLKSAARVVSIGADVLSVTKGSAVPGETWNNIPAASKNYAAARDALKARIVDLLQREGDQVSRP